jgi:hypothetical protein
MPCAPEHMTAGTELGWPVGTVYLKKKINKYSLIFSLFGSYQLNFFILTVSNFGSFLLLKCRGIIFLELLIYLFFGSLSAKCLIPSRHIKLRSIYIYIYFINIIKKHTRSICY